MIYILRSRVTGKREQKIPLKVKSEKEAFEKLQAFKESLWFDTSGYVKLYDGRWTLLATCNFERLG